MSVDEILRKDDATQSTSHYETLGSGGDDWWIIFSEQNVKHQF
jgi:hypothetical protein